MQTFSQPIFLMSEAIKTQNYNCRGSPALCLIPAATMKTAFSEELSFHVRTK